MNAIKNETLKIGRAWNNRLDNINELLSWMYEEDILNKGEKERKDSIFRKYYRYYNDGDIPRGFRYESPVTTKNYLENSVNEFITEILKKKQGKYSRADFRRKRKINSLTQLKNQADSFDAYALLRYFAPRVSINHKSAYDEFDMATAHKVYDKLDTEINKFITEIDQDNVESFDRINPNHVISYRISTIKERGFQIPNDILESIIDLEDAFKNISDKIEKAIMRVA